MNLFGFGTYGGIFGHYFRLHVEANTYYKWLDYMFTYDEEMNGFIFIIEFCKIQLYLGLASNIQDLWHFSSDSYFLRQEHANNPELINPEEDAIIEEQY